MKTIRVGDWVSTNNWKDSEFKVTNIGVGYKKDCFETDIGELYFMDNRFNSWIRKKKQNAKLNKT
jgi:hypothetical protein